MFSNIFGSEKTNEILDKTFSNNRVVSKLLNAEKLGFELLHGSNDDDKGVILLKQIIKSGMDVAKCKEKYWNKVRTNLLGIYDEETTDAIIEHYNPLIDNEGSEILYNWFGELVHKGEKDNSNAKVLGINIEFDINTVLDNNYSKRNW